MNRVSPTIAAKPMDVDYDWGQLTKMVDPSNEKMMLGHMWDSLDADCFTMKRDVAEKWYEWRNNGGPMPEHTAPYMRPRCRNHHWSLLGQCVPHSLEIMIKIFVINRVKTEQDWYPRTVKIGDFEREQVHPYYKEFSIVPLFALQTTYQFSSITPLASSGAIYQTSTSTDVITFPGSCDVGEFALLFCWFCLTCHIFARPMLDLIWMPMELNRVKKARRKGYINSWDECVTATQRMMANKKMTDRYSYTFAPVKILLQLLGLQLLVAVIRSTIAFFFDKEALPMPIIRTEQSEWCALQKSLSYYEFIRYCGKEANMGWANTISEVGYGLIFHPVARTNHRFAILTGFVLSMCVFNEYDGTYWVGRTLAASWHKMWTFVAFFMAVIIGFSFLFYTRFSAHFEQFETVSMSFYTLICFSFSVPYPIDAGMDPFWDYSSQCLIGYYIGYSIAVLTLALNFFTTIILDAYADIKDDKWKPWWETNQGTHQWMASMCFPGLEEELKQQDKETEEQCQQLRRILSNVPKNKIHKVEEDEMETIFDADGKKRIIPRKVRKAPVRRAKKH